MRLRPSAQTLSQDQAQLLLLEGAAKGNLGKIDRALAAGADINYAYDRQGLPNHYRQYDSVFNTVFTVIALALYNNREDIALALLQRGADPLQAVIGGYHSSIHQAAAKGMDRFIEAVAREYPLKHFFAASKPIFSAGNTCSIKGMKALVAAGEDINSYDSERTTPLFDMFGLRDPDSEEAPYIHALLETGADIYARTPEGEALIDTVHPLARPILTIHLDRLREGLQCKRGAGMKPERLVKDGKPTSELLQYCGADMVGELFTEYRWHGREAEAIALFDKARACVPDYYTPRMDAVDLTPLRREAGKEEGSAVGRYVRQSHTTEIGR